MGRLLAVEAARRGRADRRREVRRVRDAARSRADAGPAQRRSRCGGRTSEGLRLDEAMHPLAMLATGLYGQELPPQDGAPIRLVVPWKYGFKGIKSIVKITLAATRPADDVEHRRARRVRLLRQRQPAARPPALEPGHRAADRRVGPPRHAAVQRLRRSGRAASTPGWISMSTSERLFDTRLREAADRRSARSCRRRCSPGTRGTAQLGVNAVNFAIRTTGLVGLVLLTLSLLVTPLRELTGWSRAHCHAPQPRRRSPSPTWPRTSSIFFLLDREASVSSTVHEIATRRYLWFGTGALVLMIPLAATSTDAMVARLGATAWKRLHRLAYPIAIGAVVHYYLLVKSDVTQPLAFAAAIGVLLALPRGRALSAAARRGAPPSATARHAPRSPRRRHRVLVGRAGDRADLRRDARREDVPAGPGRRRAAAVHHAAGQYLNLSLTIDGQRVNRSYTIASSPTRAGLLRDLGQARASGCGSRHLHDTWCEGQRVSVSAPAGRSSSTGAASTRRADRRRRSASRR